jgi:beta-phosphoglucomutase family hydrolase
MSTPKLRLPDGIRACLFDMDGVLTDTASVHAKAWKETFDDVLRARDGDDFRPFDIDADYGPHVDGKPREDGVRDFLASRGITLSEDEVDDIAERKTDAFREVIDRDGVKVFDGSARFVRAAREAGMRCIVVSASANTPLVLQKAGIDDLFDDRVDGTTLAEEHLKGKPAPDSFLRGAEKAGVEPAAAAVFEDALAGVEAGRAGHFGITVGVDRHHHPEALKEHGADVVVSDLAELLA